MSKITMRAKFSCKDIQSLSEGYKIILEPVYSGSEENREFFQYTPFGKIEIGVVSPSIAGQMQIGRDYYVDFTPAPEQESEQSL